MKRIFITGISGFIGYHLAKRVHTEGNFVIGIDNLNDYYDPFLKKQRKESLLALGIETIEDDISKKELVSHLLTKHKITHIVHLAAQAGVRYSMQAPFAYEKSNIHGFLHILEACRKNPEIKFIFASSSSVYGSHSPIPFSEDSQTDFPLNLYGATKKANEVMAYSYHHLYDIPMVGLRFFTVYGPWGRPDMAYFAFTKAICEGTPIKLHNHGKMERDFTYIDDIIDGIVASFEHCHSFDIFNLGRGKPVPLMEMVFYMENALGKKAQITSLPMQAGEAKVTWANIDKAKKDLGYHPKVSLKEGLDQFISWYEMHCLPQS